MKPLRRHYVYAAVAVLSFVVGVFIRTPGDRAAVTPPQPPVCSATPVSVQQVVLTCSP